MSTFDGRSVLITGGGTGIGKGCAQHFLAHGATVTIVGPDGDVLESAAAELRDATGSDAVRTTVCDVTEEEQVERAVATAAEDGGLDVLVSNAGTAWPGPVQLMDKAQWHFAYDVNVVGTALCISTPALSCAAAVPVRWWRSPAWRRCGPAGSCPPTTSPRPRWTRWWPAPHASSAHWVSASTVSGLTVLTEAVRAQLTIDCKPGDEVIWAATAPRRASPRP